jgi:hypothetical protein
MSLADGGTPLFPEDTLHVHVPVTPFEPGDIVRWVTFCHDPETGFFGPHEIPLLECPDGPPMDPGCHDDADLQEYFEIVDLSDCVVVGVPESAFSTSSLLSIRPGSPNPFSPQMTIRIETAERLEDAVILIHEVSGRLVRRISVGELGAGALSVTWDGRDDAGLALPSGTYFYRIEHAGGVSAARKSVLVR